MLVDNVKIMDLKINLYLNKVVLNKSKQYNDKKKISNPIKRYKASMNTIYLETIMFNKIEH